MKYRGVVILLGLAIWMGSCMYGVFDEQWELVEPEVVEKVTPAGNKCEALRLGWESQWDETLEVYLPINWDWRECMGVGRH